MDRLLVIGGGLAGLACALACTRAGFQTDLVEARENVRDELAHVNVPPNMLRDLMQLGVAEDCVSAGFPYRGIKVVDARGRPLFDLPTDHLAGPRLPAAVGIRQAALTDVLINAARSAGAVLRFGVACTGWHDQGSQVVAQFDDRSSATYDLVLAADGSDSAVRRAVFGDRHQPAHVGQSWWRCLVRRPPRLECLTMAYGLDGGKAGAVPVSNTHACVVLTQREPSEQLPPLDHFADEMRTRLAGCGGLFADLRRQITDASQVSVTAIRSGLLPSPWFHGGVLVVGDAAHTITPHLGQCDAQCLEDAVVLGDLLRERLPREKLLERFMNRRYDRCRVTHESSLQIAAWELQPRPDIDLPRLAARQAAAVAHPA